MKNVLPMGLPSLTDKQRLTLGGGKYKPRVREPGEALPRDFDKMSTVYVPPVWATRTGR